MAQVVKEVKVKVLKCPKCGHEWITRTKNPKACPRCHRRLD